MTNEQNNQDSNAKESKVLDEAAIVQYITDTFDDVHVATSEGNSFFFFGPFDNENKFPFATLVTNDNYDQTSDLHRPSVFRLNIGIGKPTFLSLFGSPVPRPGADGVIDSGYDYIVLD